MSVCLILVLCLTSVYCADWNTFQETTNTSISLLNERTQFLIDKTEKLLEEPQKEAFDVVIHFVNVELVHLSDFEKSIKPELTKNSETSFVKKTVSDINLIRDELNKLLKTLQEVVKMIISATTVTKSSIVSRVRATEDKYLEISRKVSEYFLHKTDEDKTKIFSEIVDELFKVRALIKELELIKELLTTHGIPGGSYAEKELFLLRNIEAGFSRQSGRISAS